jgi:hypothetical protein
MDIFYYWKNYDEDLKSGRIGWLKSERQKLGEMRDRYPDQIWAFKTPSGRKGQLQLVARLAWSDKPTVALPKLDAASVIYYDSADTRTAFFGLVDAHASVESLTQLLRGQFPAAFRANFQGDNGIQIMDGDFLRRFLRTVSPFVAGADSLPPLAT